MRRKGRAAPHDRRTAPRQGKETCDDGGFDAFREKFCPDLGRTRVYELLSIGANKKSIKQVRAETRARTAKSRANKKNRGVRYVADKSEPAPEPSERQESPPEVAPADTPSIVPEQRPGSEEDPTQRVTGTPSEHARQPRSGFGRKDETRPRGAAAAIDL